MIYLGLDYGEKRIGVARSDELGRFAEPVGCIQYESANDLWLEIKRYVEETGAGTIVVGLPKRTTGELKSEADRVLRFSHELQKKVSCDIVTWDERFTTQEAERILRDGEVGWRKRKEKKDALAAAILLQSYLDYKRLVGNSHV